MQRWELLADNIAHVFRDPAKIKVFGSLQNAMDRTTWITLDRLSTWESTNDKSVRSECMKDGTLDTPRTIAIEPCSHGGSFCRSVMHDRSAENLCLRRARGNDPFIRYQNMEILLRWCLGLLRETSTHLESVILPWVKPAYPLVVSSPLSHPSSSFFAPPPSPTPSSGPGYVCIS